MIAKVKIANLLFNGKTFNIGDVVDINENQLEQHSSIFEVVDQPITMQIETAPADKMVKKPNTKK